MRPARWPGFAGFPARDLAAPRRVRLLAFSPGRVSRLGPRGRGYVIYAAIAYAGLSLACVIVPGVLRGLLATSVRYFNFRGPVETLSPPLSSHYTLDGRPCQPVARPAGVRKALEVHSLRVTIRVGSGGRYRIRTCDLQRVELAL